MRVLDPCCGGGAFLVAAASYLIAHDRSLEGIAGWDVDPIAVEITRHRIWCLAKTHGVADERLLRLLSEQVRVVDGLDAPGEFDALLSNPPFGNAINKETGRDASDKARLKMRFPDVAKGAYDFSFLFAARTTEVLRRGGRYGLVMPRSTLSLNAGAGLRERLCRDAAPETIWCPEDANLFDGADVFVALLVGERGEDGAERVTSATSERQMQLELLVESEEQVVEPSSSLPGLGGKSRGGKSEPLTLRDVATKCYTGWLGIDGDKPATCVGEVSVQPAYLSALLSPMPTLATRVLAGRSPAGTALELVSFSTVAQLFGGCATGPAYELKPLIVDSEHDDGLKLVTTGLIDRDTLLWGQQRCRYLKADYSFPRWPVSSDVRTVARARDRQKRPKILVAGLSKVIEAYLDEGAECAGVVSTWVIIPKADSPQTRARLTAWLNHPLTSLLYLSLFSGKELSGGNTTIGQRELGALPFPTELAARGAHPIDELLRSGESSAMSHLIARLYGLTLDEHRKVTAWHAERMRKRRPSSSS